MPYAAPHQAVPQAAARFVPPIRRHSSRAPVSNASAASRALVGGNPTVLIADCTSSTCSPSATMNAADVAPTKQPIRPQCERRWHLVSVLPGRERLKLAAQRMSGGHPETALFARDALRCRTSGLAGANLHPADTQARASAALAANSPNTEHYAQRRHRRPRPVQPPLHDLRIQQRAVRVQHPGRLCLGVFGPPAGWGGCSGRSCAGERRAAERRGSAIDRHERARNSAQDDVLGRKE